MLVEIGYMGSRASKLVEIRSGSDTDSTVTTSRSSILSTSPVATRPTSTGSRVSFPIPSPDCFPARVLTAARSRRATSAAVSPVQRSERRARAGIEQGRSWFHMLQTRFEKRYSSGFNLSDQFPMAKDDGRHEPAESGRSVSWSTGSRTKIVLSDWCRAAPMSCRSAKASRCSAARTGSSRIWSADGR